MSIGLAHEKPDVQRKGPRANFTWRSVEPWDERRLAAFLMVKHRRNEADWTRRPSPFFASLGRSVVECSMPVAISASTADVEKLLTDELVGILAGAERVYQELVKSQNWRVEPTA
ncbi:MAG TPA: hypothetical protein VNC59_03960 [Thermoanaerobaculia bacterium]|nr:hypothetical protein [Thermoanaerobaculia bacterium]